MPDLWLVVVTGLLAGGVSCLAVQGGLLATAVAQNPKQNGFMASAWFLGAKLVAHVALGALLGLLGSAVSLSVAARAGMQTVAGIYMLGVAAAMLEVHPVFRHFILQPPQFLRRFVRHQSKSASVFAPAVLGAATVLIPCGTTQAMMVLAIGTGNPMWGAAVLGAFVLGTSPLFLAVGTVVARLGEALKEKFMRWAGFAVVAMAVWTLGGAMALWGMPVDALTQEVYCTVTFCPPSVRAAAEVVTVEILPDGYRADNPVLKAGSKATIKLVNEKARGCSQVFTIPQLGVNEVVGRGQEREVVIDVPKKPGKLAFTCGMGMYSGQFTVVN